MRYREQPQDIEYVSFWAEVRKKVVKLSKIAGKEIVFFLIGILLLGIALGLIGALAYGVQELEISVQDIDESTKATIRNVIMMGLYVTGLGFVIMIRFIGKEFVHDFKERKNK